jgi:TonB-dependent receptor
VKTKGRVTTARITAREVILRANARHWLLRTVSTATLCAGLHSAAAFAQQRAYDFNLPRQSLSASLREYARVSGQQIIFTEDLVRGLIARPLRGNLSAADALQQLLVGTGLVVEHGTANAIMIRREQQGESRPPSAAPQAPAPDLQLPVEQVFVTGLIYSLQASLNIKKEAPGLVDAVSAEDIGKFPDVDLAAAMQRIPGVTASRGVSSLGGVPTSIGGATEITVRGFGPSFNETLFGGRRAASGIGRDFDFSAIGADFVSEVDVMKTPDAALSSGAIGATVNIKFPLPFDHPGFRAIGSASTTISPEQGNPTPNLKALVSDTFDGGRFGILVDGGYSLSRTRGNHVNIQGWEGTQISPAQLAGAAPGASTIADTNAWFIQDYGIYQETTTETRVNGRAALQWRPADTLFITLDDNYSRDTLHAQQYGYTAWFNGTSLRDVTLKPDGTIVNFVQPGTPTDFQSQINGSVIQNNDTGLNLRWQPDERLAVSLDLNRSEGWLNPGGQLSSLDADVGYGASTDNGTNSSDLGIVVPGGHNLPYPTGYGPYGNAAAFIDNGLIGSHVMPILSIRRHDRVQQGRLEASWTQSADLKLVGGYQYVGEHRSNSNSNDFVNNNWQAYAGYGPASNNLGTHGVALPQSLFTRSFATDDFIAGFSGSRQLPGRVLAFDAHAVLNHLQGLGNPQVQTISGFNADCCTPPFDGTYRLAAISSANTQIVENTHAAYAALSTRTMVGDMPLRIHAGLRGELTETTSIGLGQSPTSLTVQPSDHTAFAVEFTQLTMVTAHDSHAAVLPSLDLALDVTEKWQVRFDISRTLTRPPLNAVTPVLTMGNIQRVGSLVANSGNPRLAPYESVNMDFSVAWYYGTNSYVSVNAFAKDVSDFVVQSSARQTINNVIDPSTGAPALFTVTTSVNGPAASVYGAEFAVQHMFGDSGFGLQANATLVGTDKPYNPMNLAVSGFAVTGLADSANFVGFYDKGRFQARVALNWRDQYLDHFGQLQNNSRFGTEPTFVNTAFQLDFSTSYAITPRFDVYFAALNLTDATFSTHGRFSEQLLDAVDYGRHLTLGFRYSY